LQIDQELTKLQRWLWWHPFLTRTVHAINDDNDDDDDDDDDDAL